MEFPITVVSDRNSLIELQEMGPEHCPFFLDSNEDGDSVTEPAELRTGTGVPPVRLVDFTRLRRLAGLDEDRKGDNSDFENWRSTDIEMEAEKELGDYLVGMLQSVICQLVVISNESAEGFEELAKRERKRTDGVRHLLEWLSARGAAEPRYFLIVICQRELDDRLQASLEHLLALDKDGPEYEARFLMLNRLMLDDHNHMMSYLAWPTYVSRLVLMLAQAGDSQWLNARNLGAGRSLFAWRCFDMIATPPERYVNEVRSKAFDRVSSDLLQGERRGEDGKPEVDLWRWSIETAELTKPDNPNEIPKPENWLDYDARRILEEYRPGRVPEDWSQGIEAWKRELWECQNKKLGIQAVAETQSRGGGLYQDAWSFWDRLADRISRLSVRIRLDQKGGDDPAGDLEQEWGALTHAEKKHRDSFSENEGAVTEFERAKSGYIPPHVRWVAGFVVALLILFTGSSLIYGFLYTWDAFTSADKSLADFFRTPTALALLIGSVVLGVVATAATALLEVWRGKKGASDLANRRLLSLRNDAWEKYLLISQCFRDHLIAWTYYRVESIRNRTVATQGRLSELMESTFGVPPDQANGERAVEETVDPDTSSEETKRRSGVEGFRRTTTLGVDFSGGVSAGWEKIYERVGDRMEERMKSYFVEEWGRLFSRRDPNRSGSVALHEMDAFMDRVMHRWDEFVRDEIAGFLVGDPEHQDQIGSQIDERIDEKSIADVGFRSYLSCQANEVDRFGFGMVVTKTLRDRVGDIINTHRSGQNKKVIEFDPEIHGGYLGMLMEVCEVEIKPDPDDRFHRLIAGPPSKVARKQTKPGAGKK